jgi:hypothetical protein
MTAPNPFHLEQVSSTCRVSKLGSFGLQLRQFALEASVFQLLGLHLAVAWEGMLRIAGELLDPVTLLRRVKRSGPAPPAHRNASILDQAECNYDPALNSQSFSGLGREKTKVSGDLTSFIPSAEHL